MSAPRQRTTGVRRRVARVEVCLSGVVARAHGQKTHAQIVDIGLGGMQVEADIVPDYGEALTIVVRLAPDGEWLLLPGTVRWFTARGFGMEFKSLSPAHGEALGRFLESSAA